MSTIDTLVGPSYISRSSLNNNRELINFYLEADGVGGRYPYIALPTPGLSVFASTTGTKIRALWNYSGAVYGVTSDSFFTVDSDGNVVYLGDLNSTSSDVDIDSITDQIALVDGVFGYTYTVSSNTFAKITDVDFPNGAKTITSMNGRFICEVPNTDYVAPSDLRDGTAWQQLNRIRAESFQDRVIAVHFVGSVLFILGEFTTEIWQNDTSGQTVLIKVQGVFIDYGCAAAHSVVQIENSLFWLSQNRRGQAQVLQTVDFNTKPISTSAVNNAIGEYSTIDDAIAFAFQEKGHVFYVLTFPTENVTWLYDTTTGSWSKWASYISFANGRQRSNCYTFCYGKHLVGDYQSGAIYEINSDVYEDGNSEIRRLIRFPFVQNTENKRTTVYNFELNMQSGVGLTEGQGSNPEVMFRFSPNGGKNWGSQSTRNFNVLGNYDDTIVWLRVGSGPIPYGELTFSDPVYTSVLGGTAIVSPEVRDT